MKILIIAYFFPPKNTIGSLRPYHWAKYFTEQGHDVTIATVQTRKQRDNLTYDLSKFKIIQEPLVVKKMGEYTTQARSVTENSTVGQNKIITLIKKVVYGISSKTGMFYGTRFPDLRMGWVKRVVKRLETENYDVVLSTGCPYIVHTIAYKLKSNKKFIWIMDWRDLWTKNSNLKGLKIFQKYEMKLEKLYHENCDLITTVSDGLKDELQSITKTEVKVIYNGFDPDEYKTIYLKERKQNSKLVISYLGTITKGYRDPEPLIKAIYALIQEGKIEKSKILLNFAGDNSDISNLIKKYSLEECYTYLGKLSREESLQLQYDSDILLFLESEHNTKGILTGKLFEYLSLGREILAVGIDNNHSAGKLIEECSIGTCLGIDVDKIKLFLIQHLSGEKKISVRNSLRINEYTRDNQSRKLLIEIEKLKE